MNDLFLICDDMEICNSADDNTFNACDKNLNKLIERLESVSIKAIHWFKSNYIKLNKDKCHILVTGHKYEHIWAMVVESRIWESQSVKLLGINIDELKFNDHINKMCDKAGNKTKQEDIIEDIY